MTGVVIGFVENFYEPLCNSLLFSEKKKKEIETCPFSDNNQGIMVTGVSYYLQAYVIEKKGPVFQAMSQPLNVIITVIGSVLLLGEAISLGRWMNAFHTLCTKGEVSNPEIFKNPENVHVEQKYFSFFFIFFLIFKSLYLFLYLYIQQKRL